MKIRSLRFLIFLLAALPLLAQRRDSYQGHDAVANQVLLRLNNKTAAVLQQLRNLTDADDLRELNSSLQLHLLHSRTGSIQALLAILRALPTVTYVEPDYFVKAGATPNDPSYPQQWSLHNTTVPGADIAASQAWDVSTGSTANVVGIVDTGIDYTHPDLAPNMWSAPSSFTVTLSWGQITCPAGSHGYNAITRSCDPRDDHYHGTHVAGSVGAAGNNSLGVVGVNWTTRMMGLKFLDSTGSGTTSDAIDAIEFAVQAKAVLGAAANVRVLSNSWGGDGFSQSLLDEINKANSAEMLFVVAAGNSGQNNDVNPSYPAAFIAPNLISVAATTNSDSLASFSNFGRTTISLGAPGVNILSTVPGSAYGYLSGTSMATPHVAGAAMLVLSKCTLNTAALKSTLLSQVDPLVSLANTVTGGRLNVNKALRSCAPSLAPAGAATFVKTDSTTSGSWRGVYGNDGSVIANGASTLPAYAALAPSGNGNYTWVASTSDTRAVQKPAPATDRIAACWVSGTSFSMDLTLTDSNTHQVALYMLDWDGWGGGRTQRVDVLDAGNGATLDTRTVSGFMGGQYLVWNLSGHVVIRITNTNGGSNAVISGLFFTSSSAAASGGTASFVKSDATTRGTWQGVYGGDGGNVFGDSARYPAYASVTPAGNFAYTWVGSTTDPRAMQKQTPATDRVAACFGTAGVMTLDIAFNDSGNHQVALYLLDWDGYGGGRAERVEVLDGSTSAVLDTRLMSAFAGGQYLVWTLSGHVVVRITNTNASSNAVVSGLLFGPAAVVTPPSSSATFLRTDTTTRGTWQGTYGAEGATIAGNSASLPAYASLTTTGNFTYTWVGSTSDSRAMQKFTSSTDRIAACWGTATAMSMDLTLTGSSSHQVALYLLDWDGYGGGRAERVEVMDAATNAVLDTRTVSAFGGGQYLVWNLSGHVIIRLTNTNASSNAVAAGLLFGTSAVVTPPSSSATYLRTDTATHGSWHGVYGADGATVAGDSATLPAYATLSTAGNFSFTWLASTTDSRAPQKLASTTDRIAACWGTATVMAMDLNLTDGNTHQVALYLLDWDGYGGGRAERVEILDTATSAVLDTRTVGGFNAGQYLLWNLAGHVTIRVTNTNASANAVANALFFR